MKNEQMLELEEFLKSIGSKISRRREVLNMTQRELAEKMGVTQPVINKIENHQNMTLETLWRCAKILDLELCIFKILDPEEQKIVAERDNRAFSEAYDLIMDRAITVIDNRISARTYNKEAIAKIIIKELQEVKKAIIAKPQLIDSAFLKNLKNQENI